MTYSIDAMKVGSVCVPAPVVFWRSRYFEWVELNLYAFLVRSVEHCVLVDAGMTDNIEEINDSLRESIGAKCQYRVEPDEELLSSLARLGVTPRDVDYVVLTHLHQDHVGPLQHFSRAQIYLSRRDWVNFVMPSHLGLAPRLGGMPRELLGHLLYDAWDRMNLCNDEQTILPGLSVFRVGAHTPGSQSVLVETRSGTVLLAGDVVLTYENLESDVPAGATDNLQEAYEALARIRCAADIVVPGHDPLLLERFPSGHIA